MTQPLRTAFLGIDHPHGAGWRDLLVHLEDEIELTALMPGYDNGTTSLEERYAAVPRFGSVEELIAGGDFEAAIVCLPNGSGPSALLQLANAGKHLLAEKPVAGCADDLENLRAPVEEQGLCFQNGYMWRYDDGANRLREMIRDGRFGKLISVETSFVTSDVRRRGPEHYLFDREVSRHGFFNWLACHFLDLLLYVTGERITGVTARTGVFGVSEVEVEDGGIAIFDLSGGGVATFLGGYWIPRWAGESGWTIRGSERWVHWKPSVPETGGVLEIHGPQPQWYAMEETCTLPKNTVSGYGGCNGLALIQDWLDGIREDRPCRNTLQSTITTLELMDVIHQSSREQRRVECDLG